MLKSCDHLFAVSAMTVTASSDYIAQFMPDQPNAVQLHTTCTEVALVHQGGVVLVKVSSGGAQLLSVSYTGGNIHRFIASVRRARSVEQSSTVCFQVVVCNNYLAVDYSRPVRFKASPDRV